MKLGQTDATQRRIGPLRAIDDDGNPVVDFSAPGAVEIRVNGGAFSAAGGSIVAIGDGYVYYQATAGDASVRGFVVVKLAVVCQETTLREEVELAPQGISAGTDDEDELHVGPLRVVDEDGVPLVDLTGVDVEITVNGAAWSAAAGDATIDDGYVDYAPDPTEAAAGGWIAVKLTGACQEVVFRSDIVEAQDTPAITVVSPTVNTTPGEAGGFPRDWSVARLTPVVIDIDGAGLEYACVVAHYPVEGTAEIERVVYRRGSMRAGFANSSTAEQVTATKLRLSILPDSGWPSSRSIAEISFSVDAIAGGAISDVGASS